jgi:hypothetical protein
MRHAKITILNSSILTAYGDFGYQRVTLDGARRLVKEVDKVQSAIGHGSTAAMLSELLEYPIHQNRMEYKQQPGEAALIFKLNARPPEGKVLDRRELEEIGYEMGLLIRTK